MYLTQGLHRSMQQDATAIATVDGDRARTFAELGARVARLAGGLRDLGVVPGDRVAYLGPNSDRFLEWYLALAWMGAVAVPVNTRWSPGEIAFSLVDSGTSVLVVDDARLPQLAAIRSGAGHLTTLVHSGDAPAPDGMASFDELATHGDPIEDTRTGGDALAGIFYTGGTTGFPKGVMLSHLNLLSSGFGSLSAGVVSPSPSLLHVAPMFHIADFACAVSVLVAGGKHVMLPGFDPVATMAAVQAHRITDLGLIPIMLQILVDHPALAEHDTASLRSIMYGGSSIPVPVLERALERLPGVALVQAFGQTEAAPVLTWLGRAEHENPARRDLLASAGRAAMHTEVRVVDPNGDEVVRGQVGEIVGRGPSVMLGYWNRPEETLAALRHGWLHTGDVGRMDADGYLFVLDRIKDMIVTGGENVFCAEVEQAIATHPAVSSCAVIGLPDPSWGERVHAVVVPAPGATVVEDDIGDHVRARIAGYKVPRSVEFVTALPVSAAGKILKRQLRDERRDAPNRRFRT